MLATPLADKPKGRSTAIDNPAKELQAAPLRAFCSIQHGRFILFRVLRPSLALPELFGDLECCQISLVLPAQDQLVMNQARQGRTTCRQHLF